jgi:acyl carrier protein
VSASDALLDGVRSLVERVAGPSRTPPGCGPATRLSEGGFELDSVELLEVVVGCEEELGIVFDATRDLTHETLETLGTLTEVIRAKHPRVRAGP